MVRLLRILGAPSSNLCPKTSSQKILVVILTPSRHIPHVRPRLIPSSSFIFHYSLVIRRYRARATDSTLNKINRTGVESGPLSVGHCTGPYVAERSSAVGLKKWTVTNGVIKCTEEQRKYFADRLQCHYPSQPSEAPSQRSRERQETEIGEIHVSEPSGGVFQLCDVDRCSQEQLPGDIGQAKVRPAQLADKIADHVSTSKGLIN
jgi:hypothetical protein